MKIDDGGKRELLFSFIFLILFSAMYIGVEYGKQAESPEKRLYREKIINLELSNLALKSELNSVNAKLESSLDQIVGEIGEIKGNLLLIAAKQDARAQALGFNEEEFNSTKDILTERLIEFQSENTILDYWNNEKSSIVEFVDHFNVRESVLGAKKSASEKSDKYHFIDRPVDDSDAWLSSRYGYRTDPFNGSRAWHGGIDFAGLEGSNILAISAGVVTFSGVKGGYGTMVEIGHTDGVYTRYGHNKENLVKVGDIVAAGQVIAKMGNTGRSTGPHLHFEVINNGKTNDPLRYLGNPIESPD